MINLSIYLSIYLSKFLAFTILKFINTIPFHTCKEILHKSESWGQFNFNYFETSFYIRTIY